MSADIPGSFQHPFAPSTATEAAPVSGVSHEYLHQVESLTMSLTAWHHSVQSPSPCNISTDTPSGEPRRSLVDGGILALAYLCRILLETGPRILTLPRALGYPPQSKNKSDQADGCASTGGRLGGNNNNMVQVSDVAMECAWKILQVCDNYDDGTASNNKDLSAQDEYAIPIWLPLATFYAGLIVWCRMRDDHSKGALEGVYHSASARRRIMKDFQSALGRMGRQLECATAMADTIQQLCS